jgi:hypothetical protein
VSPDDNNTTAVRPPPDGSEAVRWVAALLRDQAERWRSGHRRPVEGYLTAFPLLARHPDVGVMLAADEFVLRVEAGERPQLSGYVKRFPAWANRLADEILFLQRAGGGDRPPRKGSPTTRRGRGCPATTFWPKSAAGGWRWCTTPARRP